MPPDPAPVEAEHVSAQEYAALADAVAAAEAARRHGTFAVDLHLLPHGGARFAARGRPALPPALLAALAPLSDGPPHAPPTFPLAAYRAVAAAVAPAFAPRAALAGIPGPVRAAAQAAADRAAREAPGCSPTLLRAAVGAALWDRLLPFQRDGVLRAARAGGRTLLADDMGMGKTVSALAVAQYFRATAGAPRTPVLVLCPATLRDSWVAAVSHWLPGVPPTAVHCISSARDARRLADARARGERDPWDRRLDVQFVVCSYDIVPRLLADLPPPPPSDADTATTTTTTTAVTAAAAAGPDALRYRPTAVPLELSNFHAVIADESHSLKNINTSRARACVPVILAADFRILVSGTPVMSRPAELFTQLHCLFGDGPLAGPFVPPALFAERYCGGAAADGRGATHLSELNALLSAVMVRRTKAEARLDLPPKLRSHTYLDLTGERLKYFERAFADRDAIQGQLDAAAPSGAVDGAQVAHLQSRLLALNTRLFSATSDAKIPGIVTRLRQLLAGPGAAARKVLLFAFHRHMLDAAQEFCNRERVRFVRLDGSTPGPLRAQLVDVFQSDATVRIALLSIQTAGTGLTLTRANHVLFAELDWVPSNLAQAEDRAHRIGQKAPLHVEYAVARGTLDDRLWPAVKRKLGIAGMVVDGVRDNHGQLDPECAGPTLATSGPAVQATCLAAADGTAWGGPRGPQGEASRGVLDVAHAQAALLSTGGGTPSKRVRLCPPAPSH